MKKTLLFSIFLLSVIYSQAQKMKDANLILSICSSKEGFYKDIFMDGGIKLTSLWRLPAADFLNLSIECFTTKRKGPKFPATTMDSIIQHDLIIGNELDYNGILLYPDGEPRFRMIYMNGGKSVGHGESLGEEGRNRIREFVKNGGSYVGSCAGAFFSSIGYFDNDSIKQSNNYLGIWPGLTRRTRLSDSYTGLFFEKGSPLLKYFTYSNDNRIDSVRHNGGCYAYTQKLFPKNTEVLMRYDYDNPKAKRKFHKEINSWAYKIDEKSGRIVVTGSHPESIGKGDRLALMSSMILYALEGGAAPTKIKGKLKNGKVRKMHKRTQDNMPSLTMIGDKQYHHFVVDIPSNAHNIKLTLEGEINYDLFLFMDKDNFAFKGSSLYSDISIGSKKEMSFDKLSEGQWHISVYCNTTVDTEKTDWGYKYIGKISVLNGVPYNILIEWDK